MAFITHASKRVANGRWLLLFLWLSWQGIGTALADDFVVRSASSRLHGGVYMLDANIAFQFGEKPLEALHNGVTLTILIELEVERERKWWLDEEIAFLEQRFQLSYHALSHQYLLVNLNSGALEAYPRLEAVLSAMGTLHNFPLLDKKLTDPDEHYEAGLRALLDIEALPSPLRPLAYITPSWRLRSDWYTWSLTP